MAALTAMTPLAMLTGCEPAQGTAMREMETGADERLEAEGGWPFWPVEMRLHPLSRLVVGPGQRVLEARVEFTDEDDVTSRAYGQLRIDLHPEGQTGRTRPLSTWEIDLTDAERNRQHFDAVTRTYLLRLTLEDVELPDAPELRAYFLSADGARMEARMTLRTGGG